MLIAIIGSTIMVATAPVEVQDLVTIVANDLANTVIAIQNMVCDLPENITLPRDELRVFQPTMMRLDASGYHHIREVLNWSCPIRGTPN